jgi:hypothetical protein
MGDQIPPETCLTRKEYTILNQSLNIFYTRKEPSRHKDLAFAQALQMPQSGSEAARQQAKPQVVD